MELARLWTIKAKKQRNKWYLEQFWKAFLYAGISLPPQQSKDELCVELIKKIGIFWVLLFEMKMTGYPYWMQILYHFERRHYFSNGLTIPFLIGAKTIVNPGQKILTIRQFLDEASVCRNTLSISIMKCNNIGEYVIGILDCKTKASMQTYKGLYKQIDNLIITDNSFGGCQNLDCMVEQLESKYHEIISKGYYSRLFGEWTTFSTAEKERLLEVFN